MKQFLLAVRALIKKIIFSGIALLVSLLLLEVGARLLYRLQWHEPYAVHSHSVSKSTVAQREQRRNLKITGRHILHPYAGFVLNNPTLAPNQILQGNDENRIFVALTGGSVAVQFSTQLVSSLQQRLKAQGRTATVELDIYATPGHKQPQQLMQLAFAYALGKSYQLVINIDGYNDAVLPFKENQPRGVSLAFPRLWDVYISGFGDDTNARELARVSVYREWMASLAHWRESNLIAHSAVVGIVIRLLEDQLSQLIRQAMQVVGDSESKFDLQSHGPALRGSPEELHQAVVGLWHRSSLMMEQLVRSHNGLYLHFLQPNQYVPDSKPFSTDELSAALDPESKPSKRREMIRTLYPMMIQLMQDEPLQEARFYDLTMVLKDRHQTLYRDPCCHFNAEGVALLVGQVADLVAANLDSIADPQKP